ATGHQLLTNHPIQSGPRAPQGGAVRSCIPSSSAGSVLSVVLLLPCWWWCLVCCGGGVQLVDPVAKSRIFCLELGNALVECLDGDDGHPMGIDQRDVARAGSQSERGVPVLSHRPQMSHIVVLLLVTPCADRQSRKFLQNV